MKKRGEISSLSDLKIIWGKWGIIGKGSFAEVFLGVHKRTNKKYALKKLKFENDQFRT